MNETSDAFCAKSSVALRTYLDKRVKDGGITPDERKAVGRVISSSRQK